MVMFCRSVCLQNQNPKSAWKFFRHEIMNSSLLNEQPKRQPIHAETQPLSRVVMLYG